MNPYATGNYLRKEAETLRTQLTEAREMLAFYQEQNRALKAACKRALEYAPNEIEASALRKAISKAGGES